jgi:hypothetical protein
MIEENDEQEGFFFRLFISPPDVVNNLIFAYLCPKELARMDTLMSGRIEILDETLLNRRTVFLESLQRYESLGTYHLRKTNQKEYIWMCLRGMNVFNLVVYSTFNRNTITEPIKEAFVKLKQIRIEGVLYNSDRMTQLLYECRHLERLEIETRIHQETSFVSLQCPLKVVVLLGSSCFFFDFDNTLEVLSLRGVYMIWTNIVEEIPTLYLPNRGYTNLTTIKLQSCSGITNAGLTDIANCCEKLVHFEIGNLVNNLNEGVLQIFEVRSILRFVSVHNEFSNEMMRTIASYGILEEFGMTTKSRMYDQEDISLMNILCVKDICRHNILKSLAVSPHTRIVNECLKLIVENCQEGLQQFTICPNFNYGTFLLNVLVPVNGAMRNIEYLTLPGVPLTDEELVSVSNTFHRLKYLVINGHNITDSAINLTFHHLESLTINDANKITTLNEVLLRLKYIHITHLAVSVADFMSWTVLPNNIRILNLDVLHNIGPRRVWKMINRASEYGFKSEYPLPGGYVGNFGPLNIDRYGTV